MLFRSVNIVWREGAAGDGRAQEGGGGAKERRHCWIVDGGWRGELIADRAGCRDDIKTPGSLGWASTRHKSLESTYQSQLKLRTNFHIYTLSHLHSLAFALASIKALYVLDTFRRLTRTHLPVRLCNHADINAFPTDWARSRLAQTSHAGTLLRI